MPEFQNILDNICAQAKTTHDKGKVASYIPQLACMDINKFGIALLDQNGVLYSAGDTKDKFSIQSISKVLTLSLAFELLGEQLWNRVGVEPSGDPFNHLSLLEQENGKPRNPLINAGAIVVADVLVSQLRNPKQDLLEYVRKIAHDPTIAYDKSVAKSEKETGFRNYAAAYLIKSFGNLENEVETVLDFYFHQCSLSMSCEQLAYTFYVFANRGKCLKQTSYLNLSQVKRINAIMLSCGFYDEAGEFAYEVGLPGKSGVGGGIVAVHPNSFSVAAWSPGLNEKGNSKLGLQALEKLTTESGLSIF
ncbi:glutaminase [Flagellimonas allohymeniacidonis]|uniref:Glutaminase n=1 Tax=Flagellimonas allohymeniacidonis TaxID=2517819 RepID=A0A4V2HSM5_9FLAO|nr:glutaminase [Allomuricauda hymeniacidonis]TAI48330.1 glutaminase [Allomuricauda hymeniacidonis]